MVRDRRFLGLAVLVVAAWRLAGSAEGQQCNDFNACTANDMCSDGECTGTPASSGSCDDFNECTVNERCVDFAGSVICMGDPAPVGTECQGGCGTCQPIVPVPGVPLNCVPRPGSAGNECQPPAAEELGPCLVGHCMEFGGGGFTLSVCLPEPVTCSDTDGNPCTDACNFETGRCEPIERPCGYPDCTRCDPATGSCMNVNQGGACDDFNECTAQSRCEAGLCVAGEPTQEVPTATPTDAEEHTPTPTRSAEEATPTNTVEAEATPTMPGETECVGDCNHDGNVFISETVTMVNIGLETLPLSACPAADASGNGRVAINEIILGVGNGLNGCPA